MLSVGDVIAGRYQVEALLGRGGMAQVWKVRHTGLGSLHALKLLVLQRRGLAKRLLLEGQIQARIRHPNVVAVTDLVEHNGAVGLVMEYVDHPSVQAWLDQKGPLEPKAALELFAPVLSAVVAAHDQGVLHRDLKPANVLLARGLGGLVPKVADFGIAKVYLEDGGAGATVAGTPMGTPGYMAPEQIRDSKNVDARADVFSLGAVLYALLTGRAPFESDDDETVMQATLTGTYEPIERARPGVSPEVADVIRRALEVNPADRFPDVRAMARALYLDRADLLAFVEHMPEGADPMTSLGLASMAGKTPPASGAGAPTGAAPGVAVQLASDPVRPVSNPTLVPAYPPITLGPEQASGTLASPATDTRLPVSTVAPAEALPQAAPRSAGLAVGLGALGLLAVLVAAGMVWRGVLPEEDGPAAVVNGSVQVEPGVAAPVAVPPTVPVEGVAGAAAPAVGVGQAPGGAASKPSPGAAPLPVPAAPAEAGAPAPVAEALPVAIAAVTPAPEAPVAVVTQLPVTPVALAPVAVAPRVVGKWTGMASGRPLAIELTDQDSGRVRGNVVIQVGALARTVPVRGTITPDGRIVLDEVGDGGLRLEGTIAGSDYRGTFGKAGGKMLPFTASK